MRLDCISIRLDCGKVGGMDVLTDWVKLTGASGGLLARSRMKAPWGMALSSCREAMFHVVLEGPCWLRLKGQVPRCLHPGDVVLLPHGPAHDLVLERGPPPEFKGPGSTVLCGAYRFDASFSQPLLAGLPAVVHLPAARVEAHPSLADTVRLLARETQAPGPGSEWLLSNLFDVLLVYLVRAWSHDVAPHAAPGWLVALRDPSLSRALDGMHRAPESPWTVESLAREAHLSRAAFARRFTESVGEAPLAYLTRWRMGLAARLLRESGAPLAEIAARVGYESEFSFSRAFKRSRGVPPNAFRREGRERARAS
jgi:AraC-like DNA-binding protein